MRNNLALIFSNVKINNACIVLEAYINMHWSFILPFIQVNFWFKEPYVYYNKLYLESKGKGLQQKAMN